MELEDALREAKSFQDELQDSLQRLGEIDGQLSTSKPVGGLPETAKEQLDKFKVGRRSLHILREFVYSSDKNKLLVDTALHWVGNFKMEKKNCNV